MALEVTAERFDQEADVLAEVLKYLTARSLPHVKHSIARERYSVEFPTVTPESLSSVVKHVSVWDYIDGYILKKGDGIQIEVWMIELNLSQLKYLKASFTKFCEAYEIEFKKIKRLKVDVKTKQATRKSTRDRAQIMGEIIGYLCALAEEGRIGMYDEDVIIVCNKNDIADAVSSNFANLYNRGLLSHFRSERKGKNYFMSVDLDAIAEEFGDSMVLPVRNLGLSAMTLDQIKSSYNSTHSRKRTASKTGEAQAMSGSGYSVNIFDVIEDFAASRKRRSFKKSELEEFMAKSNHTLSDIAFDLLIKKVRIIPDGDGFRFPNPDETEEKLQEVRGLLKKLLVYARSIPKCTVSGDGSIFYFPVKFRADKIAQVSGIGFATLERLKPFGVKVTNKQAVSIDLQKVTIFLGEDAEVLLGIRSVARQEPPVVPAHPVQESGAPVDEDVRAEETPQDSSGSEEEESSASGQKSPRRGTKQILVDVMKAVNASPILKKEEGDYLTFMCGTAGAFFELAGCNQPWYNRQKQWFQTVKGGVRINLKAVREYLGEMPVADAESSEPEEAPAAESTHTPDVEAGQVHEAEVEQTELPQPVQSQADMSPIDRAIAQHENAIMLLLLLKEYDGLLSDVCANMDGDLRFAEIKSRILGRTSMAEAISQIYPS